MTAEGTKCIENNYCISQIACEKNLASHKTVVISREINLNLSKIFGGHCAMSFSSFLLLCNGLSYAMNSWIRDEAYA